MLSKVLSNNIEIFQGISVYLIPEGQVLVQFCVLFSPEHFDPEIKISKLHFSIKNLMSKKKIRAFGHL